MPSSHSSLVSLFSSRFFLARGFWKKDGFRNCETVIATVTRGSDDGDDDDDADDDDDGNGDDDGETVIATVTRGRAFLSEDPRWGKKIQPVFCYRFVNLFCLRWRCVQPSLSLNTVIN